MKTSSSEFVIEIDNSSDMKAENSEDNGEPDSMEGDGYHSDPGGKEQQISGLRSVDSSDGEKELHQAEEAAALGIDRMLASEMRRMSENGENRTRHGSREPPVFSATFSNSLEVFKCSECPYETYNVATLTSHQKIHKLYQCDICQMKFSHAANMRRHRMRHTGFKPFECRVCLKRFFRKDHLMEHMITHSKQLPFQCPMCDKRFDRQVYFKAHLQTDHWNLPSDKICGICGHKAATIKGAKLHYTTRHARAANTVNSNSPANSRLLAEESLGEVTRKSLMSARLERGPTLLSRLRHPAYASAPKADGSPGGEANPAAASPSQLLFPTPPHLLSDSLTGAFSVPLGGGTGTFPDGPLAAVTSHVSPSRQQQHLGSDHRRQLSSSVTLHCIPGSSPQQQQRRYPNHRFVRCSSEPGSPPDPSLVVKTEMDDSRDGDDNNNDDGSGSTSSSSSELSEEGARHRPGPHVPQSPRSEAGSTHGAQDGSAAPSPSPGFASSLVHRQVSVGDVTITPLGGVLACNYCGIVFPDQTLYFLHKGVHSENSPWKCNICGELCRDKYDFNTHILSKAHQ